MQKGFLDAGGIGWQDAQTFDRKGQLLWTYGRFSNPGQSAVNSTAAHDFGNDGITDVVVGCNGDGGVVRLDMAGNIVWQQPDANVWHVEIADADGDGTAEIIHSNAGGQITIRDATGKILRRFNPEGFVSEFSLCRWPSRDGKLGLLFPSERSVRLFDFAGKELVTLEAPGSPEHDRAIGTGVRFKKGGPEYLAVVTTNGRSPTLLFVYGPDEKLVQAERLEARGFAIAVQSEEDGTESLLVGGLGKVWRYRPAR